MKGLACLPDRAEDEDMTNTTYTCRGCNQDLKISAFPTFRTGAGEYHRNTDLCRACKKAGGQVPAKVASIIRYAERMGCLVEHTVEQDALLGRIDRIAIRENVKAGTLAEVFAGRVNVDAYSRPGRATKVYAWGYDVSGKKGSQRLTTQALQTAVYIMGISSPTRNPEVDR